MKIKGWVGIFGVLLYFVASLTPAYAKALDDYVQEYMQWIVDNSEYTEIPEPPKIEFRSPAWIQVEAYGPEAVAKDEMDDSYNLMEAEAIYNHNTGTMYLREDFDPVENGDTLVHELVHHFQAVNGEMETAPCIRALEKPAYMLSNKWVDDTGHPGEKMNKLTIFMVSLCHPTR